MDRRKFTKYGMEFMGIYLASGVFVQCTSDNVAPTRRLVLTGDFTEEFLQDGVTHISWEVQYINRVNIDLLPPAADSWQPLASHLPATTREFQWDIGAAAGQNFRLRISDAENDSVFTESPPFNILRTATIDLSDVMLRLAAGESIVKFHPRVGEVAISRTAEGAFTVLNLQCPHNGCRVELLPGHQKFDCPCHGSTFTTTGCLLTGPAEEGLKAYRSALIPDREVLLLILSGARPAC